MAKSKIVASENRKPLIDASPKKKIEVKLSQVEMSEEQLKREMEQITSIAEAIRKQNYSSSAAVNRVKKRTFRDLVKAKIYVAKKQKEEDKREGNHARMRTVSY